MTTHTTAWPAGTPCCADLMASDLNRTRAFCTAVLGWDYTDSAPEYGGYSNTLVGGRTLAGPRSQHRRPADRMVGGIPGR